MKLLNEYVSKIQEKMPLEALLFFMNLIWVLVTGLTAIVQIGMGILYGFGTYLLLITFVFLVLFFVPVAAIGKNMIYNRSDSKKVLCCLPLLIVGIHHFIAAFVVQTKTVMYVSLPDSLIYTLLLPIQKIIEISVDPLIEAIFFLSFPYNLLIPVGFEIVILPISLFIYLLPSIGYDWKRSTREMKLIVILPLICIIIPVVAQTIKSSLGMIDEIMADFFWVEIISNIGQLASLLIPILGILYIIHYNKVRKSSSREADEK